MTTDPAASAAGKALRALRKTHEGRPPVWHTCPHYGEPLRAKDIGHHKPRCPKNPHPYHRIQAEIQK